MANVYKNLNSSDFANTRSILHESLTIPDGVVWNTYPSPGDYPDEDNIQNLYSEMAQQVYDYSITNAAANHIFDITLGVHEDSDLFVAPPYDSTKDANANKRKAMYNLLAQRLVGFGDDGTILKFDKDGDFSGTTTDKYNEVIAITLSRLAYKDEIKKGSFELKLALNPSGYDPGAVAPTDPDDDYDWGSGSDGGSILTIDDVGAESDYRVNSPAGEYGILYATQPAGPDDLILDVVVAPNPGDRVAVGLIYYQAGVVVLNPYLFEFYNVVGTYGLLNSLGGIPGAFGMFYDLTAGQWYTDAGPFVATKYLITDLMQGYQSGGNTDVDLTITTFCDAFRQRIYSIEFQNSIELNSTIYFCRVNHNEFNYSSNPSYLDGSKIRVKTNSMDAPVSYITGVGLYDATNGLLATAKLSEPVKKSTDVDLTLRVRLDY
jgi:hypothetical protein